MAYEDEQVMTTCRVWQVPTRPSGDHCAPCGSANPEHDLDHPETVLVGRAAIAAHRVPRTPNNARVRVGHVNALVERGDRVNARHRRLEHRYPEPRTVCNKRWWPEGARSFLRRRM